MYTKTKILSITQPRPPGPSRRARYHPIRLRQLGVRYFPFVLGEEDKVICKQLELGTVLKPTLPGFGFIIDFNEILSKIKKTQLSKAKEGRKWKATGVATLC